MQLGAIYTPDKFDIMGYCDNTWASEYTYAGILQYLRSGVIPTATIASAAPQPVLLISGSLSNGTLSVDPVFSIQSTPTARRAAGRFVVEGLSADGRVLFSQRFDGSSVGDLDPAARTFAIAVPYDASVSGAVASISVRDASGGSRPALLTRAGVYSGTPGGVSLRVDADPQLLVRASGTSQFTVTWNSSRYPSVVVRNTRTHRVLGIGRNGEMSIGVASLAGLELLLSNGVSSTTQPLAITGAP